MSLSAKCCQSYCSLRELRCGAIVLRALKGTSRAIVLCSLGVECSLIGEGPPVCLCFLIGENVLSVVLFGSIFLSAFYGTEGPYVGLRS